MQYARLVRTNPHGLMVWHFPGLAWHTRSPVACAAWRGAGRTTASRNAACGRTVMPPSEVRRYVGAVAVANVDDHGVRI
jgi:hypothetical protein